MSPSLRDYAAGTWQLWTGYRVRGEQGIARNRARDLAPYLDLDAQVGAIRVLDLANGQLRPQYLLLRAAGHRVVGVDLANRPDGGLEWHAYGFARWLYRRHLPARPGARRSDPLACGDVGALPFRSGSFDLVTSVAAFEHFLDVPAVLAELRRVLRPGGLAWIGIHPFTCPSGAHNLSATEVPLRSLPPGVEPWDHLRRRRLPITVPLNEWRIDRYLEEWGRHLEVLRHYCAMREGEALLTPAIEGELAARGYTRDELTCGAYVIVARRPA
jgi:SAM-dependent methyltransferase